MNSVRIAPPDLGGGSAWDNPIMRTVVGTNFAAPALTIPLLSLRLRKGASVLQAPSRSQRRVARRHPRPCSVLFGMSHPRHAPYQLTRLAAIQVRATNVLRRREHRRVLCRLLLEHICVLHAPFSCLTDRRGRAVTGTITTITNKSICSLDLEKLTAVS